MGTFFTSKLWKGLVFKLRTYHDIKDLWWHGGYTGMCRPNGSVLDKKSLNMGPIFDPQIPKHGSIFRQNHKNFLGSQRELRKFSKNP